MPTKQTRSTKASSATVFFSQAVSSSTSSGAEKIAYTAVPRLTKAPSDRAASEAVYNHLRFLRSCGRSVVGVDEVAAALGLSMSQVERAAASLKTRGIKLEY